MTALSQTGVNAGRTSRGEVLPIRTIAAYDAVAAVKDRYATATPVQKAHMNVAAAFPHTKPFGVQGFNMFNEHPTTFVGLFPGTSKSITGVVTDQNGSPLSRTVLAFNERNKKLIAQTTSDGSGNFTIKLLNTNETGVMLVAIANTGEARNSVVFHNVAPV